MKKLITLALIVVMILTFVGCNKTLIDTTYAFDKAIISLPDGQIIEGTVEGWTDYEDGDQIQVKIDGTIYLVHSENIVLIKEK